MEIRTNVCNLATLIRSKRQCINTLDGRFGMNSWAAEVKRFIDNDMGQNRTYEKDKNKFLLSAGSNP